MAIGQLDVKLALDTAEFSSGVKSAQSAIGSFGAALSQLAGRGLGVALGEGIAQAVSAIKKGMDEALDSVKKFRDAAIEMGAAGQAINLGAAAAGLRTLGVESKAAQEAMTTLATAMKDKMTGEATDATRALDKLGVAVKTSTGEMRPAAEVLQEVINKFAGFTNDAQKAAAAQALFGKSASDNAVILQQTGTAALDAANAANASQAEWAALAAGFDVLRTAAAPVIDTLALGLTGALFEAANALSAMLGALQGPIVDLLSQLGLTGEQTGTAIRDAFELMAIAVGAAVAACISLIQSFIAALQNLASIAVAAAKTVAAAMAGIAGSLGSLAAGDFKGAGAAFAGTGEEAAKLGAAMKDLGKTVIEAIPKAADAATKSIGEMGAAMDKTKEKSLRFTVKPAGGGGKSIGDIGKPTGGGGGGKKGGGGGKGAVDKEAESIKKYAEAVLNAANPTRVFDAEMKKFEEARAAGLLTWDQYGVAVALATKKMESAANTAGKANDPMKDFEKGLKSWGNSVASSLADAIVEGKDLNEVFQNLIKSLVKMALEMLVFRPLMNAITSGFSGMFGGAGGLFKALPMSIPPAANSNLLAANSPRAAATGLVFNRPRRAARAAPGGVGTIHNSIGSIAMNITPQGGATTADTKTGQQFGERVRMLIQREMVAQSRPGGLLRQGA